MIPSILGCVLLGVVVPEPESLAKYWLEVRVIEYSEQRLKKVGGTAGFELPKNARIVRTMWHPLVDSQPATVVRNAAGRLHSQVRFNRYGVEAHHVEIGIEHTTGQGRDEFTHGAAISLDLEPGSSTAFGDISCGSRRRQAFMVTLRRWK